MYFPTILTVLGLLLISGKSNSLEIEKREFKRLIITPCSQNNSLVTIKRAIVSPMPAIIPGDLKVIVEGSMNQDMPKLYIKAHITKKFFGGLSTLDIPCISGFGSCVYDVCKITENVNHCPKEMVKHGIPCKCPFNKFSIKDFDETFTVKEVPPLIDWLSAGDYEGTAEVMASPGGPSLACYDIKASVRSKEKVDCDDLLTKFSHPDCSIDEWW